MFNWLQQCSGIPGTPRYIILRSCRHRRVISRQALVLVARQSGNELQLNSGWIWGQRGGVTSPTYPPDTHVSLAPPACHCESCVWLTHNSFALTFLFHFYTNTLLLCVNLLATKYIHKILSIMYCSSQGVRKVNQYASSSVTHVFACWKCNSVHVLPWLHCKYN